MHLRVVSWNIHKCVGGTDGRYEPQRIIDEFVPEFAKLSIVTLMLPWGE